jgi:hypothetical protein
MLMQFFYSQTEILPKKDYKENCMLQFSQNLINLFIFLIPFICIAKCTCIYFESKNTPIPLQIEAEKHLFVGGRGGQAV